MSNTYTSGTFPLFVPMVCRNICEKIYSKIIVGQSHIQLVRNTAGDANVTLSPKKYFVNVVECSSGPPGRKRLQGKTES